MIVEMDLFVSKKKTPGSQKALPGVLVRTEIISSLQ